MVTAFVPDPESQACFWHFFLLRGLFSGFVVFLSENSGRIATLRCITANSHLFGCLVLNLVLPGPILSYSSGLSP